MIQWGWFYILFNYSHQIPRILPETILVRMQIIGKISSFVRHKIESADVIDAESLDLRDQCRILGEDDAVIESFAVSLLELIAKKSARSADIRIGQDMRDLDLS